MCHTTYYHPNQLSHDHADNHHLNINSLSLQLTLSSNSTPYGLPDFLTFVILPRINGTHLNVNGSKFRPDTPAFITLHRVVHNSNNMFASKDRVHVSDGTSFEVYVADYKLFKGVFRQEYGLYDYERVNRCSGTWKLECKGCMLMKSEYLGVHVKEVEVCVGYEPVRASGNKLFSKRSDVVIKQRVELKSKRCRRRFEVGLEDIPEERDCDVEEGSDSGCGCCGDESDSGEEFECEEMKKMEMEIEGMRWAVDVGIWAACLGVGLLVSGVSARRLLRKKLLL